MLVCYQLSIITWSWDLCYQIYKMKLIWAIRVRPPGPKPKPKKLDQNHLRSHYSGLLNHIRSFHRVSLLSSSAFYHKSRWRYWCRRRFPHYSDASSSCCSCYWKCVSCVYAWFSPYPSLWSRNATTSTTIKAREKVAFNASDGCATERCFSNPSLLHSSDMSKLCRFLVAMA